VHWRVRTRWYPWRRALSLRDTWNGSPAQPEAEAAPAPEESADSGLPKNLLLRVLLIVLAGIVWVAMGLGKVLFYSVGALLFVAASLVELVLELALMPFALLLRLFGAARWPVEIARQGKHFTTEYAEDLDGAATLADELVTRLESGNPPQAPAPST
jgi:hypothetical protein